LAGLKKPATAGVLAVVIERAARMQVLAESIGTIKPIKPEIAREAHDYRLKPFASFNGPSRPKEFRVKGCRPRLGCQSR
jgi:hypothetical protein